MTFGRVNELGQFISDFDPGPEQDKKGLGKLHYMTLSNL